MPVDQFRLKNGEIREEGKLKSNRWDGIIILMNFGYNIGGLLGSPEEIALYYNSLCLSYDCTQEIPLQNSPFLRLSPFPITYLPQFPLTTHPSAPDERPTDDAEHLPDPPHPPVKVEIKMQQIPQYNLQNNKSDALLVKQESEEESAQPPTQREKNFKKNTESNLINNVFSYVCSEPKSHRVVNELVGGHPDKLRIFYIFANNFKRINGKYLNRKNIKAVCEIAPRQPHAKMLAKSIKRLLVLPLRELRPILRRLIFSYLRGPDSLLPLLTSKKICKVAMRDHMTRRRHLAALMTTMLTRYD